MARVCIGIPAYGSVKAAVLQDYMRLAFWCGRRMPEHDFMLAIKTKMEQFRARNSIVTAALQMGCDYILQMDDDHIIDWEDVPHQNPRYSFLKKFIDFLEEDPKRGIIGALYYHRGGDCRPVVMEMKDGCYHWINEADLTGGIQEVDVTGGGCFLIRREVFDKIPSPWFEPELKNGTDIQICTKTKDAGFSVWCDTGTILGHIMDRSEIVTPENRYRIMTDNHGHAGHVEEGMDRNWLTNSSLQLYRLDAMEYLGLKNHDEVYPLWHRYEERKKHFDPVTQDPVEYYRGLGKEQLARQLVHHFEPHMVQQLEIFHKMINLKVPAYGLDYGCGSAPVTFHFAMHNHRMDFVDVDGAGAYEFLKWRVKKRGLDHLCGWKVAGPYDYAFMLDSIEHLANWREVLLEVIDSLKPGSPIITNYFQNKDFDNNEHISMDHDAVKQWLVAHDMYPMTLNVWVKQKVFPSNEIEASSAA